MATRCNIIIKDDSQELFFYRHWDGYPSNTGNDLINFIKSHYQSGKCRNNPQQSAGWLIIYGNISKRIRDVESSFPSSGDEWKVGDYEPTDSISGDAEYVYTIDLIKQTLVVNDIFTGKKTTKRWNKLTKFKDEE